MPVIAKVTSVSVTTGPVQNVDLYKSSGTCKFSNLPGKRSNGGSIPGVCALPAGVDYKDIWIKRSNDYILLPHSPEGWKKGTAKPACSGRNCRGCRGGCGTVYTGVVVKHISGGTPTPRSGTPPKVSLGTYPGHLTKKVTNGNNPWQRGGIRNNASTGQVTWYEGYRGQALAMTYADFTFQGFGFRKYAYSINGIIKGTFDCPAEVNGRFTLNFRVNRADGNLVTKGDNAMQLWGYDSDTEFMVRKCVVF